MNKKLKAYLHNTIIGLSTEMINGHPERFVHFFGYGYPAKEEGREFAFLEYTFHCGPLKDVLAEGFAEYEQKYNSGTNYITDCTEKELIDIYEHYDNGNKPLLLDISSLSERTPDGMYVVQLSH